MKRKAIKAVSYTRSYKAMLVSRIVHGGESIAKTCALEGVANTWQVRSWVKSYLQEKGIKLMPKVLNRRKPKRRILIPAGLDKEMSRLEERNLYLECTLEAMYAEGDSEIKKKLLSLLSPSQREHLKRTGKLSI